MTASADRQGDTPQESNPNEGDEEKDHVRHLSRSFVGHPSRSFGQRENTCVFVYAKRSAT